uniref:Uncharacterized protein n=1 Tax=Anguilla anguilla TaxID=7936 RepID=A0A0E9WSH7_ANGAN
MRCGIAQLWREVFSACRNQSKLSPGEKKSVVIKKKNSIYFCFDNYFSPDIYCSSTFCILKLFAIEQKSMNASCLKKEDELE